MKNWLVFIALLAGLIAGAGATYFMMQDPQPTESTQQKTADDSDKDDSEDRGTVQFTSRYRGAGDRNGYTEQSDEPIAFVITSQAELNRLWSEMFVSGLAPPKPAVDFETQVILVAMPEQKPTGGYLATIQSISNDNGNVSVLLEDKAPGNACFNTQALTRPVHIVTIGRISIDTIDVEVVEASGAPCAVPLN